eukprot:144542_1
MYIWYISSGSIIIDWICALSDDVTVSIGPLIAVHAAETATVTGIILAIVIGVIGLVSSPSRPINLLTSPAKLNSRAAIFADAGNSQCCNDFILTPVNEAV